MPSEGEAAKSPRRLRRAGAAAQPVRSGCVDGASERWVTRRFSEARYEEALPHYARAMQLNPQMAVMHFVVEPLRSRRRAAWKKPVRRSPEPSNSTRPYRFGPLMRQIHDPAFAKTWERGLRLAGLPE